MSFTKRMSFTKHDKEKPDYSFLEDFHPGALDDVMRVLAFGAKKYSRSNWAQGDDFVGARRRFCAAAMRHLIAGLRGDDYDEETQLPHFSAVIVNMLFADSYRRWEVEGKPEQHQYQEVQNHAKDRIAGDSRTARRLKKEYYGE